MKVSELITALEEFEAKLTAHEELLAKRAGQRAELSEAEKQAALEEQSRWLSRRLGALRPYIERFDTEWLMQQPATGVTWDALEVATSLTGHPGKKFSLRHVFPKLLQILGRLETLDPNEEIAASARHTLSANDETRSGRAFEREVASIYRALGTEVEHDVALLGMQIDLVTRERTPSGGVITSAIECKYYSRPAGIGAVNQFASVALLLRSQGKIDRAMIVALSGFTRPAREAARSHNIELLELDDLKQRLKKVKPAELEQARAEVEAQEVTDKNRQQPRIFVVMPFAAEFQDVYILGIREVAEKLGFVIERADEIEHNNSIVQIILERIRDCDAVIADTTGRNPNVFYEVGYAHALGKPTILIARKGEMLPFDVQSINFIIYESLVDLRQRLESRIKGTGLQIKRVD
jgi:hypothetical protein